MGRAFVLFKPLAAALVACEHEVERAAAAQLRLRLARLSSAAPKPSILPPATTTPSIPPLAALPFAADGAGGGAGGARGADDMRPSRCVDDTRNIGWYHSGYRHLFTALACTRSCLPPPALFVCTDPPTHRSFSAKTHNLQVAKRCKQASFLPPVRAAAFTPRQKSLTCRYLRAAVRLARVNCNTRLDHRSTRSGVVSTSQLCGVCSACKQQAAGTGIAAEAAARRAQLG